MSNTRVAYRSSTGALTGAQRAEQREKRIQFVTARNTALMGQRSLAAHRLAVLRHDIANVHRAIVSGAELSDAQMVERVLEHARASERKLVDEITRLSSKIR